jgi:hypothetical protein
MHYEEKIIRYIASKLIQRKYYLNHGEYPQELILEKLINRVVTELKDQYKELKYVRIKSPEGIVTPQVRKVVDKLKC